MEAPEKLMTTLAAAVAAFAITKVLDVGWQLVTGQQPPEDDDDDVVRVAIFAGISAVAVTVARRYAMRGTNRVIASHRIGQ